MKSRVAVKKTEAAVEVLKCADATLGEIKEFVGEGRFYQADGAVYVTYHTNMIGRIDNLKNDHVLVRRGAEIVEVLLEDDFLKKYEVL